MAIQYVLPAAVSERLENLRRRVRQLAIVRGIGMFLLLGTVLFVGILTADFLLDLDSGHKLDKYKIDLSPYDVIYRFDPDVSNGRIFRHR